MKLNVDPKLLLSQATTPDTARNVKRNNPEALKKTCQQFEALFIQSMFKTMRDSVPEGGLIEKGNADGIYQSLFDQEVATQAARHNGIGIADMLYEQLSRDGEDE